MGAALILCRVARACARRSMPPDMSSAEFCSAHGDTFVAWLRDNTQECKCDEKYGTDEARQRGDVTDDTEIFCRRPPGNAHRRSGNGHRSGNANRSGNASGDLSMYHVCLCWG